MHIKVENELLRVFFQFGICLKKNRSIYIKRGW